MKVSAQHLSAFLNGPPDDVIAILVYGKDAGLVHERVLSITRAMIEDPSDPFRISELDGKEILSDPAKLTDEYTALCLGGGKRVVRIRLGNENISDNLSALFDLPKQSAVVLIEAGFLNSSSPVRKLLEKELNSAVVACYQDRAADLSSLISEVAKPRGIVISDPAKNYLLNHLGSDRMVTRSELEKLVLFVGANKNVSIEDVVSIVGDTSTLSIEELVFAATDGNKNILSEVLFRDTTEEFSTIAVLRATQRHLHRLLLASAACAEGRTTSEAIKILRPPVLFMFVHRFERQLRLWTPANIGTAIELLTTAEIECKSTGLPQGIIGERALLRLNQIAKTN